MPVDAYYVANTRTYEVTAADIINRVRHLTQDETAPYRTTNQEMLRWLSDAVKAVSTLVPELFIKTGTHTCRAGFRQILEIARATALVDVIGVQEADAATLTLFSPGWQTATQGVIQNWLRPAGDQLGFYTYPPSPVDQAIPVLFVESPEEITSLDDQIPLPESYEPALVGYCTSMAESKDDESVDAGRAQTFMADFVGRVKGV